MKTLFAFLLILCVVSVPACRGPMKWNWASPDVLDMAPSKWAEESGEVLLYEEKWIISTKDDVFTQHHRHVVTRVSSEAGINDLASVKIRDGGLNMLEFRARSVSPEGTVAFFDEEDVIRDESEDGGVWIFRFPNVEVGSVLEWAFTIDIDKSIRTQMTSRITDSIPIRRYRLEVWVDKQIKGKARGFNLEAGEDFQKADVGNFNRYTLALDEIAPRRDEWAAPHWTKGGRWWMYQARRADYGRYKPEYQSSWAHVSKSKSKYLFLKQPFLDGFEDTWKPNGCQSAACVGLALASVHEDVKSSDWGGKTRKLATVLEDGWGSGWEKNLLLGHRLSNAGLTVNYGLVNFKRRRFYKKKTPLMTGVSYLVVQVPKQEGIPEDLWLDGSCEYCAVGEIPRWIDDAPTLRLRYVGTKFKAKIVRPTGTVLPPGEDNWAREVRIETNGDVTVINKNQKHRQEAVDVIMEERSYLDDAQDWQKDLEDKLKEEHPDVLLVEAPPPVFDREHGQFDMQYTFQRPGYALLDGDEMLVPLEVVVESPWDLPEERFQDLVLSAERREHKVSVVPPDGWEVSPDSLPEPIRVEHAAATSELSISLEANGNATLTQQIVLNRGSFDVEQYPDIRGVLLSANKHSTTALVLRRKQVVPPVVAPEPDPQLDAETLEED